MELEKTHQVLCPHHFQTKGDIALCEGEGEPGEMVHWIKVLTAKPDNQSSVSGTPMIGETRLHKLALIST